MVAFFCPPLFFQTAVTPSGYSCTMTSGASSGFRGYDTGEYTTMGSIDAEPVPDATLYYFIFFGEGEFAEVSVLGTGLISKLTGTAIYVDNVQVGTWDSISETVASASWTQTTELFALSPTAYLIEFK